MKKIATSFLAILAGTVSAFAQWTTPNDPDDYGYSWDTLSGSSFEWVEIRDRGIEVIGLGDDGSSANFNIGFDLPFYFSTVNSFNIGSNGFISFGKGFNVASSADPAFDPFPNTDNFDNIVAPLLSDLNVGQDNPSAACPMIQDNPARIYYYSNNVDSLVITFDSIAFWDNAVCEGWSGNNTFQIVFNKADGSITFNYLEMNGSWNVSYDGNSGAAQIGLESVDDVFGLQIATNEIPDDRTTIKINLNVSPSFSLDDIGNSYNNRIGNPGVFAGYNSSNFLSTAISNIGTVDINEDVDVTLQVKKTENGTTKFYDETEIVSSITSSETKEIAYEVAFSPSNTDADSSRSYFLVATNNYSGDVASNDKNISEIVVVDDSDPSQVSLSFGDLSTQPDPAVAAELFGLAAGAVYFKPPYYPASIITTDFVVVSLDGNPATNSFQAQVWDDSGVDGAPGTLIIDQEVSPTDIQMTGITQVFMTTTHTIESGGVYIVFSPNGDPASLNYRLGLDLSAPFSNNNFEISAGLFGTYRGNATEDFLMGLTIDASDANVGVAEEVKVTLGEVYPNPASETAAINFSVESPSAVNFTIKNLIGQNVKNVNLGRVSAGTQTINFDVADLEAGIYFYTLNINEESYTKKFIIK